LCDDDNQFAGLKVVSGGYFAVDGLSTSPYGGFQAQSGHHLSAEVALMTFGFQVLFLSDGMTA
jgi:hypothetical protein